MLTVGEAAAGVRYPGSLETVRLAESDAGGLSCQSKRGLTSFDGLVAKLGENLRSSIVFFANIFENLKNLKVTLYILIGAHFF